MHIKKTDGKQKQSIENVKILSLVHQMECSCTLRQSNHILRYLPGFSYKNRRRQWHPTPVLLPGKSHGQRILVGCSPWGCEESDMTSLSLSLFTFMHWKRKWHPTTVFLPGESQGQGSLVGCRLWGHTESDRTEVT